MAYATRDHVWNLGLSAQGFTVLPRPVAPESVEIATGKIRLKSHGLSVLDLVLVEQVARGSLPPEVNAFTYYTPIVLGMDLFQLADSITGLPIVFSAAGSGWGVSVEPLRRLDMHLDDAASQLDQDLTGESTPIKPDPTTGKYPQILIGINARMAALSAVTSLQIENPEARKAVDRILAKQTEDNEQRERWRNGQPIRPTPTDQTPTSPENAAIGSNDMPPSPWFTGTI